jgi:hypothetical protein
MKTIYKYEATFPSFEIEVSTDCQILSVQQQDNVPCIWALVDKEKENTKRFFKWHGTGLDITEPGSRSYIGTIQDQGMVWHLFEEQFPE